MVKNNFSSQNHFFRSTNEKLDRFHPKWPQMQRFKRFGMTTATNEKLGKNLLVFKRFGSFAAIIPLMNAICTSPSN